MVNVRDAEPAPQVRVAVAVPGLVVLPIVQVQVPLPLESIVCGPSPDVVLWRPDGRVTSRSKESLAPVE